MTQDGGVVRCTLARLDHLGQSERVEWTTRMRFDGVCWTTEVEPSAPPGGEPAGVARLAEIVADSEEPWRVEVGAVVWDGAGSPPRRRDYALVELREHWYVLAAPETRPPRLRVARRPPSRDSRLSLGPSAVLALLDQVLLLDQASARPLHPSLDGFLTRQTFYPPSELPPWLESSELRDRALLRAGQRVVDEEAAPAWPRPIGMQGTPFGAISRWDGGGLRVECSQLATSTEGVWIESLTPLTWRNDGGLWNARLAIVDADGSRSIVPGTIRLRLDAQSLLAAVEGATADPVPALLRDPVQADRHGLAPTLSTSSALGDWLAT